MPTNPENTLRSAHRLGTDYVQIMRELAEATFHEDDDFFDLRIRALDENAQAIERLDKDGYRQVVLGIHDALLDTFSDLIVWPPLGVKCQDVVDADYGYHSSSRPSTSDA